MSNAIAKVEKPEYSKEQIDTIRRTIAMGATDAELQLFVATCERLELDPFSRQVYFIKRRQKVNGQWVDVGRPEISIDGFRASAEQTGEYEGQTPYYWCGSDGKWLEVWLSNTPPAAAKVGVYRRGFREPVWSVARYAAYVQTIKDGSPNAMWRKMADNQLAKCAEALALRRAFPRRFGGVYAREEMGQADNERHVIDAEPTEPEAVEGVRQEALDKIGEAFAAIDSHEALDAWSRLVKAYKDEGVLTEADIEALKNDFRSKEQELAELGAA